MTAAGSATVVVELTPPGRAAVAVVVVEGPGALRAIENCVALRSGRSLGESAPGRIVLGQWGGANGEELVVCRRDEARIEIHCHGGAAAVRAVIGALVNEGCQLVTWQDWVRRRSTDRIGAAAQIALAGALTECTAAILLDQLNGALAEAIRATISEISTANWSAAARTIDDLLERGELGLHLTKPWRVVVFGTPNVGKSSLINALAGYERTIVSPQPGTTRDVVTMTTALDGWPVQLSDTAGLRSTQDELESAGIELATATLSDADLLIRVHDASTVGDGLQRDNVEDIFGKLESAARIVHVINKIDLVSSAERSALHARCVKMLAGCGTLTLVSALTGEGVAGLMAEIGRLLAPVSLPAGLAVPFINEQLVCIAAARTAVEHHDASTATAILQAMLTLE